jgi:hypothetical protein
LKPRRSHIFFSQRVLLWPSIYILFMALLGNAVFDLAKTTFYLPPWAVVVFCVVLMVALWFLAPILHAWFETHRLLKPSGFDVTEQAGSVRPAKALIALVGKGDPREAAARDAALYHRETLERVWLLTSNEERLATEELKKLIESEGRPGLQVEVDSYKDILSIDASKSRVEELRREALKKHRIPEQDLVCDFTGFNKQAGAGMILACAPKGTRLEYMVPQGTDERGRPDRGRFGSSQPIEVTIGYDFD